MMQNAIKDERNLIPLESVRNWSKDISLRLNLSDALEMLIRNYSLFGDLRNSTQINRSPIADSRGIPHKSIEANMWTLTEIAIPHKSTH